jgi:hypothetical protein
MSCHIFFCEVRKADGSEYPPATLKQIMIALHKFLEVNGRVEAGSRAGIGLERKQAEVITSDMEMMMWEQGVLGEDNPKALLNTVFHLLGLHFALRGGVEQRRLRHNPSQISLLTLPDGRRCLEYREDVSKTNAGGLKSINKKRKVTRAFETLDCPERCPVRLYERYNSLCPERRPDGAFYLRPLDKFTAIQWFSCSPLGHNTLKSMVACMCKDAGFSGFFPNHSLRATCATRMFDNNVEEQLIMLKTGHRSNGVRSYKRVSEDKLVGCTEAVACKKASCTVSSPLEMESVMANEAKPVCGHIDVLAGRSHVTMNINISK